MNAVTPYNFEGAAVRALEIDGDPWFVGKDVAEALGYVDPTTAIRSHCRGVQKLHPIADTLGRKQDTRLLSEPDVLLRYPIDDTSADSSRIAGALASTAVLVAHVFGCPSVSTPSTRRTNHRDT